LKTENGKQDQETFIVNIEFSEGEPLTHLVDGKIIEMIADFNNTLFLSANEKMESEYIEHLFGAFPDWENKSIVLLPHGTRRLIAREATG